MSFSFLHGKEIDVRVGSTHAFEENRNFQDKAKVGQIIATVTTRSVSCLFLNCYYYLFIDFNRL